MSLMPDQESHPCALWPQENRIGRTHGQSEVSVNHTLSSPAGCSRHLNGQHAWPRLLAFTEAAAEAYQATWTFEPSPANVVMNMPRPLAMLAWKATCTPSLAAPAPPGPFNP
jgi:hypothetical protein